MITRLAAPTAQLHRFAVTNGHHFWLQVFLASPTDCGDELRGELYNRAMHSLTSAREDVGAESAEDCAKGDADARGWRCAGLRSAAAHRGRCRSPQRNGGVLAQRRVPHVEGEPQRLRMQRASCTSLTHTKLCGGSAGTTQRPGVGTCRCPPVRGRPPNCDGARPGHLRHSAKRCGCWWLLMRPGVEEHRSPSRWRDLPHTPWPDGFRFHALPPLGTPSGCTS